MKYIGKLFTTQLVSHIVSVEFGHASITICVLVLAGSLSIRRGGLVSVNSTLVQDPV